MNYAAGIVGQTMGGSIVRNNYALQPEIEVTRETSIYMIDRIARISTEANGLSNNKANPDMTLKIPYKDNNFNFYDRKDPEPELNGVDGQNVDAQVVIAENDPTIENIKVALDDIESIPYEPLKRGTHDTFAVIRSKTGVSVSRSR